MNYDETKSHLLAAALELAPTDVEQRGFTKLVNDMEAAGERPLAIVRSLIGALDTALRVGNWPTACPDCDAWLRFRGRYGAPGVGQSWECETGHHWARVGGAWHRPEEGAHVLNPEDVA